MAKPQWSKWEDQVASDMGGKVTPGSGNQWYKKGDVRNEGWRVSCKQTDKDSFTITRNDWREIEKIAREDSKSMAIAVQMGGIPFAVIPWNDFTFLTSMG